MLAAYAMSVKHERGESLPSLVEIMQRLLANDGCPWDREQTFASLKKYVVEEACEVTDAIDALGTESTDPQGPAKTLKPEDQAVREFKEELGDLLLQVVFQSELARARGWFGPDDVIAAINEKLVRRHPHVFGELKVSGTAEVLENWEVLKAQEKANRGLLDGMPRSLPALRYAYRVGEKAAHVGFDWPDANGPRAKVDEELSEFDAAAASGDRAQMEAELGDVLMSVASLARKHDIDPEEALKKCNRRFVSRFAFVESAVKSSEKSWATHSPAELDALWQQAKAKAARDEQEATAKAVRDENKPLT